MITLSISLSTFSEAISAQPQKGAFVMMGLVMSLSFSWAIHKKTLAIANELRLFELCEEPEDVQIQAISRLVNWRDSVSAFFTGVLIFLIACAQADDPSSLFMHWGLLVLIAAIVPVTLVVIGIVSRYNLLDPNKRRYRYWYILFVVPWYVLSLILVY